MLHFRLQAPPPPRRRPTIRSLGACVLALALAACERAKSPPPVDSARPGASTTAAPPAAPTSSGWDASIGRYLLVAGPAPNEALLIDPERGGTVTTETPVDSANLRGAEATLFAVAGGHATARLDGAAPPETADDCAPPWPVVRLAGDSLPAWSVGFVGGSGEGIRADSLAALPPADSAALAAAAARVASALPVQDEAYFRGLPFAVHSLVRFAPAAGVQAFSALLVRRVNQEDSPLEERTFLVAERQGAQGPWRGAYHERSTGTEDEVESSEALAALALGADHRPALLLVHEVADGVAYRLLERTGAAQWRARWTSAVGKCR